MGRKWPFPEKYRFLEIKGFYSMPLFGPPNIDRLKAKKDVYGLIQALKHRDSSLSRAAAEALGELKDTRAADGLLAALNHPDPRVRSAAATALGKIHVPSIPDLRVVKPLILLLNESDVEVRSAAATALGRIKDTSAVEPLILLLGEKDVELRRAAATALIEVRDIRAFKPLILLLGENEVELRQAAIKALIEIKIKDQRAVEPLILLLNEKEVGVRQAAIKALGAIRDERAVEPLSQFLNDEDADTCRAAAHALRSSFPIFSDREFTTRTPATSEALDKIGGERMVEAIFTALNNPNSAVREVAAWALGNIQSARAVGQLIGLLNDKVVAVRIAAVGALGEIEDAQTIAPLMELLKEEDTKMRFAAARALGRKSETSAALNQLHDEMPIEAFLADLNSRVAKVRADAASALGFLKNTRAVTPLLALLNDASPSDEGVMVTREVATALGHIGDPLAFEPLVQKLIVIRTADAVGRALAELDGPRAIPILTSVLFSSNDSSACSAAAHALGHTREPGAIEPLIKAVYAFGGVPSVVEAALSALGELGRELPDGTDRARVIQILQESYEMAHSNSTRYEASLALARMGIKVRVII